MTTRARLSPLPSAALLHVEQGPRNDLGCPIYEERPRRRPCPYERQEALRRIEALLTGDQLFHVEQPGASPGPEPVPMRAVTHNEPVDKLRISGHLVQAAKLHRP